MPMTEAPAEVANRGSKKSKLHLQTHGSKFVRFQEVRMQEMASEVRAACSFASFWLIHARVAMA